MNSSTTVCTREESWLIKDEKYQIILHKCPIMDFRPPWDVYFADLARRVATRSTCSRKQVGAVIVKDKNILSTGYNGSIKGLPHCNEVGCLIDNGHCVRTIHAEANAIIQAAKHGVSINHSSIYVTASPCFYCFKLIANAGIKKIYYLEFYRDQRILDLASNLGIELIDLSKVDKLTQLASQDGKISKEEKDLIDTFLTSYEDYSKFLNRALGSEKISEEEKEQLILKREKILQISEKLSNEGREITDSEAVLLNEISQVLKTLNDVEY